MPATSGITLRPWGRDDVSGMAAVINARNLAEDAGEYTTAASVVVQYANLENCDPATDIVVATDDTGDVSGYARVCWKDLLDGDRCYFVIYEGLSFDVLSTMFDWAVERALQVAAGHDHPAKKLQVWVNEGGPRAQLLAGAGFEAFAWSANMVRPHLDEIPDIALPAGAEVRPADPTQFRTIWESDVAAFRDHRFEAEATDADWHIFLDEANESDLSLWQIAWSGDQIVGQVRTFVNEGEAERIGRRRAWTEYISTHRDWRKQGMASALIARSLRQLAELGFDEAALGLDLDNPTGALGVYERMGYRVTARQAGYRRDATRPSVAGPERGRHTASSHQSL